MHEDGRVYAHYVLMQQHHALPPILLYVVLQFNTVLPVVVHRGQTVIDVAAREYEAILLAVRHYFLKNIILCHSLFPLPYIFICYIPINKSPAPLTKSHLRTRFCLQR